MTHRTQCFTNVSFLYTYIFYSFQFWCLSLVFLPSLLFATSATFFISLPPLFQPLFSCRDLTGMASLSFWGINTFFGFFLSQLHIHFLTHFSWQFKAFLLLGCAWCQYHETVFSDMLPFFVCLYNFCSHISISHLSLFHWQFYLMNQKTHGQIRYIFLLWHGSGLPTIWLSL